MNEENKNIVLYVRGKKEYEGDIYGVEDVLEKLCKDKAIYDMFFRYCNSFGDPLAEEGDSAQDVGEETWWLIKDDYDYYDCYESGIDENGFSFYEDFDCGYRCNHPMIECFMAFEEIQEEEVAENVSS